MSEPLSVEAGRALLKKQAAGKYPESKLQQQCIKSFREMYPRFTMLLFSIPNGGHRNVITAKILNAEGAMPGVSDLFFAVPRGGFHGMFIEMKYGKNTLSDAQRKFFYEVSQQNYKAVVCYTAAEFFTEISSYLAL